MMGNFSQIRLAVKPSELAMCFPISPYQAAAASHFAARDRGQPFWEFYNKGVLRDPSLIPLSHQHQHGLALAVIIDRGLKADPSEHKAEELSHKVAQMAEVELLGHFKVEEEVLFPAVRPFFGSEEIIDELIAQHRQMEELLRRLAQAAASDRVALLGEFGALLSSHIRTEERQLFEQIQQRLSGDDLLALGKQIDASVQKVCPVTGKLPWEETS